jgi:ABC-2 type transport system ATP-binding protein
MDGVLRARGLVKRFRDRVAVGGIDLDVAAGERVALLGPNGAGKTTTLLMLLGAILPDEGTIEIGGHRLPTERSRAMEQVGFAAGYLPLPEKLRVREVLDVFARLSGVRRPGPVVDQTLERFSIGHLAGQLASELSSGQRTLVGIAKATLHRPRLLVLDEPTASLDPDVADRVRQAVSAINDEDGTALLVTSHNMTDVERVCERVVFIAAGKVVADGPTAEILETFGHDTLEALFLHVARTQERP